MILLFSVIQEILPNWIYNLKRFCFSDSTRIWKNSVLVFCRICIENNIYDRQHDWNCRTHNRNCSNPETQISRIGKVQNFEHGHGHFAPPLFFRFLLSLHDLHHHHRNFQRERNFFLKFAHHTLWIRGHYSNLPTNCFHL